MPGLLHPGQKAEAERDNSTRQIKMRTSTSSSTRERIISAALEVFADVDFDEATIEDIAKRVGITGAAIYRHFKSKEDLLLSIVTESVAQMAEQLKGNLMGIDGTLNKLKKMTWYYLQFYEQNRRIAWILYHSSSYKSWVDFPDAPNVAISTRKLFTDVLQEGQDIGDVRHDLDLRIAVHMYFGALRNITMDWLIANRKDRILGM
jgi:AcrR family transcriptional regulator